MKIKFFAVTLFLTQSLLLISTMQANAVLFLFHNYGTNNKAMSLDPNCGDKNGCKVIIQRTKEGIRFQGWYKGRERTFQNSKGSEIQTASGKCLEVQTKCASSTNDCPVQIWNCTGRPEQLWKFTNKKQWSGPVNPSENVSGLVWPYYTYDIQSVYGKKLDLACASNNFTNCWLITTRNIDKLNPTFWTPTDESYHQTYANGNNLPWNP